MIELKCKDCKYKADIGNTEETGAALCTRSMMYFPINVNDDCHYIPKLRPLQCQDCCNYLDDPGCIGCQPDDSVYFDGELCMGFYDKKKVDLQEILMFWMVQGLYNREEINKMLDKFEASVADLINQK